MLRWITLGIAAVLSVGIVAVSVVVQLEAEYALETLGGAGRARALILLHPSRDAGFSQDLSEALADGLMGAGLSVDRATLTRSTPARPQGYDIVAVVSNTYFWSPDLPTLRYLKRARLDGLPVVGLVGGAGSTGRSERILGEALQGAGGRVLEIRSFWLWRPNDESRMDEPNRQVALDLARGLGGRVGRGILAPGS